MKYYGTLAGQAFVDFTLGKYYLIGHSGESTLTVYKDGIVPSADNQTRLKKISEGKYKLADEKTLKYFNISSVKDGFYGDSQYKPFVQKNVLDEDSVFVLERKDGNWGAAMISGPDFSEPDALKGSKIADEYDNNVLNGNFKQVEIQ